MSCSKQEIELKRLAAIEKLQNNISVTSQLKNNVPISNAIKTLSTPINNHNSRSSGAGPIKTSVNNVQKTYHPFTKPEKDCKPVNNVFDSKITSGVCYLISEYCFEVNPSEFCPPLINIFKTIPSKRYDLKSKLWNFSLDDYDLLMSKVAPLAPHIVLGGLPSYVLKLLSEPCIDPSTVDLSCIEPTLRNQLLPFQTDGVRFGISKLGRCMVADDMGLGKTFQALALASYYRGDWPLLIVTTSSMRQTWQTKVHSLLPSVAMSRVLCVWSHKDADSIADSSVQVVVLSYKLCVTLTQTLLDKKFGFIIIDESHYLKSPKARCTACLVAVARRAARLVLLSGTPALSRPQELYTQLHLIQPKFFKSFIDYGKRYCAGKLSHFGWDMTGQSHLAELQVILHKKFLIRRTKEQVLHNLQDKIRESVILDQSLLEYSKRDQFELSQMADRYVKTKPSDKHSALLSYFSESAKVKIPAICKYLRQLIDGGNKEKFLVFAHHKVMISAICDTLDDLSVPYVCIVGSTPSTIRAELVDRFQSESCLGAVLSTTSCGVGITLTAATLLLFAELHWNPGILTQAESRAHRIGQAGIVRVKYLLARGTVDDYMWPMLQDKLNVLNEVGLCKDTFENATVSKQETMNEITQYLTSKNKDEYIPGTNIRKGSHRQQDVPETSGQGQGKDIDKSFLEDDEGDQLLANLDF